MALLTQDSLRQKIKTYVSTWLLALFAAGLLGILAFSEIFQNAGQNEGALNNFSNPIKSDILANLKTIRLKNRLGKYTVTLSENGHWRLVEPRKMPAPEETVQKIMDSLKKISIHTLHQKEPINLQSFSLDNPIAILDLYTKLDEHLEIKIGLVNPINNTSYMTVSNQDVIFQTNALSAKFELLRLSDFVDSNIFSVDLSQVKSFELFYGKNRDSSNKLTRTAGGWDSKRYRSITDANVEKTIQSLLSIKSHMIIDSSDEKLQNLLNNYLENPQYKVRIETLNGDIQNYVITGLVRSVPDLKIEKRQYFIMKSSEREYPHLINKDFLGLFQIRYSDLK